MTNLACGCCGNPVAKISPIPHIVDGVEKPVAYCKRDYIDCLHSHISPTWGEVGHLAEVERLKAEWEALP